MYAQNGTSETPTIQPGDYLYYWFDGIAHCPVWEQVGPHMITSKGTEERRVKGMVILCYGPDVKQMILSEHMISHSPQMFIHGSSANGCPLDKCRGKWWGPVVAPWHEEAR